MIGQFGRLFERVLELCSPERDRQIHLEGIEGCRLVKHFLPFATLRLSAFSSGTVRQVAGKLTVRHVLDSED